MNSKIILPTPEVGLVLVDKIQDKIGNVYISEGDKKEPDTGIVVDGPMDLVGKRVRFREHFGERLLIDDVPHMWFSEIERSIYYIIDED